MPLFWVAPFAETLIVAQAVLLAASVALVFLYSVIGFAHGPALAVSAAYGLFCGMQQTAIFDVHEAAFAPLAVALLLLAMERRRWPWFWAAVVMVLGVKEDLAPPFLVLVGAYLLVRGERRRGAILLACSLVAFIAEVAVMIPAANAGREYGYRTTYAGMLERPWLVPMTLVTPPMEMLTGVSVGRAVCATAARVTAEPAAGAVCARALSVGEPDPLGHDFSLLGAPGTDRRDERG